MTTSCANFCQGSRSSRSTTSAPSPTKALPNHLSAKPSMRAFWLQSTLHSWLVQSKFFGLNITPNLLSRLSPASRLPPEPTTRSADFSAPVDALSRSSAVLLSHEDSSPGASLDFTSPGSLSRINWTRSALGSSSSSPPFKNFEAKSCPSL